MPTSAARSSATALENEHLRAAVGLWRLYFETGRWRGDFLADAMTASGRDVEFEAKPGSSPSGDCQIPQRQLLASVANG